MSQYLGTRATICCLTCSIHAFLNPAQLTFQGDMSNFSSPRFLRRCVELCRKLKLEAACLVGTEQLSLIELAQQSINDSAAAIKALTSSMIYTIDDFQDLMAGDVQDVYASELFQVLLSVVSRLPWNSLAAACEHSLASGDATLRSADKQSAMAALVTCTALVSSLGDLAGSAEHVRTSDQKAVLRSLSARHALLAYTHYGALAPSSAS